MGLLLLTHDTFDQVLVSLGILPQVWLLDTKLAFQIIVTEGSCILGELQVEYIADLNQKVECLG